jgi:hypothetical protein
MMHEPVSIATLIGLIERFLATPSDDPVGRIRQDCARRIKAALEARGFPATESDLIDLSVIPYVFQEANYDDIDWWSRDSAKHHQLKEILAIDFLTQMAGKRREDATDAEMEAYRLRSHRAIDFRKA